MRSEKAFAVTNTGDIKMSGKFLARASALSLAVFLAACGGDENSTPIVNVNTDPAPGSGPVTNPGDVADPADPANPADPTDPTTPDSDAGSETIYHIGTGSEETFTRGAISSSTNTLTIG